MGHGASSKSSSTVINPISIIDTQNNDIVDIVEHTSFKERSEWRRSQRISRQNPETSDNREIDGVRSHSAVLTSSNEKMDKKDTSLMRTQSEVKMKRPWTIRKGKHRKDDNEGLLDQYLSDSDYGSNNDKTSTLRSLGCEVLPLSDDYFYGNEHKNDTRPSETPRPGQGDKRTPHLLQSLRRKPSRKVTPKWQPALSSGLHRSQSMTESVRDAETLDKGDGVDVRCVNEQIKDTQSPVTEKFTSKQVAVAEIHTNDVVCEQNNKNIDINIGDNVNSFYTADKLCSLLCDGASTCLAQDPSYLLLVDTRKKRDYHCSHIHRAVVLDIEELESNDQLKIELCYKNIILYDRNGKSHFKSDSVLTRICHMFWNAGHRPSLLEGGYSTFSRKYPYLCKLLDKKTKSPENDQISNELPFYPSSIILNKLYVGNCKQADSETILDSVGINLVLNLSRINMATKMEEMDVINFPIEEDSKISLYEHSREVVSVLHKELHRSGSSILLCCESGAGVSACVCILILMYELKWSAQQCFSLVQERRTAINIDKHLWKQIKKAEKHFVR